MDRCFFSLLIFSAVVFTGCREKYDVSSYYEESTADSLLTDIITYVYIAPKGAEWNTRFDHQYREYYVKQLSNFRFEKYFVDAHNVHYFFIIRPARSAQGSNRGVIGKFTMNAGKISNFKEIVNTPAADVDVLRLRGNELFSALIKKGNVNDYLKHPDYVAWPDAVTYYDTIRYEWLLKEPI